MMSGQRRATTLALFFILALFGCLPAFADSGYCATSPFGDPYSLKAAWNNCRQQQAAFEAPGSIVTVSQPCYVLSEQPWNITGRYGVLFLVDLYYGNPQGNTFEYWCSAFQAPAPQKAMGAPPCSACVGDPIDMGNGNVYVREEDFDVGHWLKFDRYYNSASAALSDTIGNHWLHTFSRRVIYEPPASGGTATASILRPDGRVYSYMLTPAGWSGESDVSDSLAWTTDPSGTPTQWTVVDPQANVTETYDAGGNLVRITGADGLYITLAYSTAVTPVSIAPMPGLLISVMDPQGRSLQFAYNADARLATVTSPATSVAYGYDASGNLTSVTYAGSAARTYFYNESGHIAGPSPTPLLTGIQDEGGTRSVTYDYDSQGRGISTQRAAGADHYTVAYNSDGSSTFTDPLGAVRTRTFTTLNGVTYAASVDGLCASCDTMATRTYSPNGQLASSTDFNGTVTTYSVDQNLFVNYVTEAKGTSFQRSRQTNYDPTLFVPLTMRTLNAAGNAVQDHAFSYNARAQVTASCEYDTINANDSSYGCGSSSSAPLGVRQSRYTYCESTSASCPLVGLLLSVDGPRTDVNDVTTYSYYGSSSASGCGVPGSTCHQVGDLHTVQDALGHITTYASYDSAGRITRITDPNGTNTDFTYTPRGWLSSSTADGQTTSYTYNATGQVTKVTDPDGVFFTYTYDDALRLTRITDALGNYAQYTLDATGNRLSDKTYLANGTLIGSLSRQFDSAGQLAKTFNAQGNATTFGYDGNGNLVDIKDPLGIDTHYILDALRRVASTIQDYNGTTSTANTTSATAFDAIDHLTSITDADGLSTVYTVNAFGNMTTIVSPDSGTTNLTYDAAGNLTKRLDARGVTTQYTYDALNRLTAVTYPAHTGLNVTYTYDEANPLTGCPTNSNTGHLTTMTDASGSTAWCYTPRGDVRQVRQVINGTAYLQSFIQTSGRRAKYVQYPSGFETVIGYDAAGRVSTVGYLQQSGPYGSYINNTVTPLITSVTYQPFGAMTGYTFAEGGQLLALTRDGNGWTTDVVGTAINLHFARDAYGQIAAESDAPGASPAIESYKYDALNRLTELDNNSGSMEQAFTYNGTGDRLTQATSAQTAVSLSYQPGTHQVSSVGLLARANDANGNTTSLTAPVGVLLGLGYDDRNLLTVVQQSGATVGSYQYNGRGERVWRTYSAPTIGQVATVYDPAGSGNLFGEYFASDFREYVYLNGTPVASATDAGRAAPVVNYLYADHLGSLRAVTSTSGAMLWNWAWNNNGFGNQLPTGSANYYLRFPGQYYDVESGLHYNGNRYYDPSTGRYLEQDPLGLMAGLDAYSYVNSNPLTGFDALGLFELKDTPPSKWGGVRCDYGTLTPDVTIPPWIPSDCPIIGECANAHERSHINDANRISPGICHFWNPLIGGKWLGPSSDAESRDTETRAYMVEIACLEAWLNKNHCGNGKCTDAVKRRIWDIKNKILPTVYNGTY